MLHGGPGASHDYLRPGLDALAAPGRRRLFYYDQRGSGRSPLDAGVAPAPWQEHVADLDAVRAHLGGAPLTLVGYSWGALLALLYACEHRDRVARLILVSPAPAAARERAEARERLAAMSARPSVQALRARLDPPAPSGAAPMDAAERRRNRFALAVAGYFADPERALGLTPFIVKQAAEDAVWRSLGDYDLRPRLRALGIPAIVAHGERGSDPARHRARHRRGAGRRIHRPARLRARALRRGARPRSLPPLRRFLD